MIQEQIIQQPVIETERFVLRAPRREDAGLITHYTSDERVARGSRSIPHPLPPGTTEAYLKRAMDEEHGLHVWIIEGEAERGGELLGVLSLKTLDRDQSQLGYWVAPAMWNTGIASESVRALVEANPLKNKTIFAEVFQDNAASARVLTNAGFEYIGDAEAFSVARDATVPTWTYIRRM